MTIQERALNEKQFGSKLSAEYNNGKILREVLRRIPLNVRAISAKNIYQKTTHSTVTF